jgi:hypothetical protein
LDHSDGEMARYLKMSSPTGFYWDTVVNFIVQPCVFYGMGLGLAAVHFPAGLFWGALSALSSLMLMILPVCEDSIVHHLSRKQGKLPEVVPRAAEKGGESGTGFLKKLFMLWHRSILYPNFLLFLTAAMILFPFMYVPPAQVLGIFLIYFALSATGVWILQLFHKIRFKKLDSVLTPAP